MKENTTFLKFLFLFGLIIGLLIGDGNFSKDKLKNLANLASKQSNMVVDALVEAKPYFLNKNLAPSQNFKNEDLGNNNYNGSASFLNDQISKENFILKYQNLNFSLPEISAQISLVADLESGQIIWSKNLKQKWPLASLTKLVTAALILKNYDLKNKLILEGQDTQNILNQNMNNNLLKIGEIYSVEDLTKLMLLSSSNESSEILANLKNRDDFILNMNNLVKEWGAINTYFKDPSGLSVSNQSNAEDILKITQKIWADYPQIFYWLKFKNLTIKDLSSFKKKIVQNTHPFAGDDDFWGGKTGFTELAKQNLLSIFNINKKPVLILVLGSDDRALDTKTSLDWLKSNFKLVSY